MSADHDWEKVFEQVEQSLEERRRALKSELDSAWEKDPTRSSDVLNRMLAVAGRCEILAGLKSRFIGLARSSKELETEVQEIQARLEGLVGRLDLYRGQRDAVTDSELQRLASLFSEELGKESVAIDLALFSAEDVESIKRVLDRSKARMIAGAGVRPVDFGERGIEMRAAPETAPEPDFAPPETAAQETPFHDGLAQELEEETGILLADEVVDLEPTPISQSKDKVKAKAKAAALPEDDEDEVLYVDEGK